MILNIPISWFSKNYNYLVIALANNYTHSWAGKDHPTYPKPCATIWMPAIAIGLLYYKERNINELFGWDP